MERNVVEIFKGIEEEQFKKADAVREEYETKIHEIAEEHNDMMFKFAESLTDDEFAGLMKSNDIEPMEKLMITAAYAGCHENK